MGRTFDFCCGVSGTHSLILVLLVEVDDLDEASDHRDIDMNGDSGCLPAAARAAAIIASRTAMARSRRRWQTTRKSLNLEVEMALRTWLSSSSACSGLMVMIVS